MNLLFCNFDYKFRLTVCIGWKYMEFDQKNIQFGIILGKTNVHKRKDYIILVQCFRELL